MRSLTPIPPSRRLGDEGLGVSQAIGQIEIQPAHNLGILDRVMEILRIVDYAMIGIADFEARVGAARAAAVAAEAQGGGQ